jgi:alginate O-acetyltransferase complex protein AlgI
MVFASLEFLTLFLPAFMLVYALSRPAARNHVLLLGSWFFYGWLSPTFLLLHVVLTVLGWLGGLWVERTRAGCRPRLRLLALLITVNVLVLCWYKYANILAATVNELITAYGALPFAWQKVALPAGLSFIVLQVISYLVDVHRKVVPVERSFANFATYLAMFGHSIAGPIIRYDWVRQELEKRSFNPLNFALGSRRFMIGLSMKVLVADSLSPLVWRTRCSCSSTLRATAPWPSAWA